MITANETGIGPALRVLRHFTEHQRFYQIKFQSGERAILLAAGMPAPSVELVRLVLGGTVPWQTVWAYNPTRAGGYGDYVHNLKTMFSPATNGSDDPIHYIRDALVHCESLEQARMLLVKRERLAHNSTEELEERFHRHEPRSFAHSDGWELGTVSPNDGSAAQRTTASTRTDRYRIRETTQGKVITCVEAPTVIIRAERGMSVSAKQARNYAAGTIFLGGVAQGDPFIDMQGEVYNLKHPQACIQTLATCEQAILLIRKLGDLRRRDWVVSAKDADLDTIFAVWVLLNHLRLNDDSELRANVMPLLRLEGVLAAHGREGEYFSALPSELLHSTGTILNQLRQQELVFKQYGRWSEIDLLDHTTERLRALDELIYAPEVFDQFLDIEELARADIANGSIAVACRSAAGVTEVKRQLQRVYGERLGILILQNSPSDYRLHQIDPSLPAMIERAYERLNLLDPAVRGSQNRWHGSTNAAFSPRNSGTGLNPHQIIEAVQQAFRQPTVVDVVCEIPHAVFLALAALSPGLALIIAGNLLREHGYLSVLSLLVSALALIGTAGLLFWPKARRVPGLYGWRLPNGFGWLGALPAAFAGAVIGGLWPPGSLGYPLGPINLGEVTPSTALIFSLAAELLFRGVILGNLAARLPTQKSGDPWWISWPTLISSLLYAMASLLVFLSFSNGQLLWSQCFATLAGALIFGIASGAARERSESILAPVLFHWFCAAVLILSGSFMF